MPTIIAQCTPQGPGALALIRLSGPQACHIASSMSVLHKGGILSEQLSHTIHYGYVVDKNGATIDQLLFLFMKAPHTFTGHDTVEITCHNNPFIVEQIINRAIELGAQPARSGEFTQQAVMQGKIDLLQAEAINDLIQANSQQSLQKSLAQLEGSLSAWTAMLEELLLRALTLCQASFEFLDDELEFGAQINDLIGQTLRHIKKIQVTFCQQKQIREGVRIALLGSVNVGKSSLFNLLIGSNRAIVTPIAGTTRDSIEAGLYKNGLYWTIIDTAGLRHTHDQIEQEGIARSQNQAHQADIILLVFDSSRSLQSDEQELYNALMQEYAHKIIVIFNKADLPPLLNLENIQPNLIVSTKEEGCTETIEISIKNKVDTLLTTGDMPFLINKRQLSILTNLEQQLLHIQMYCTQRPIVYELIAHHLNDALAYLANLSGKSISEQAMDAVFRTFCIGK